MKKTAFIFISSLFFLLLTGCQESTKSNSNQYQNNYCYYNPQYCNQGGVNAGTVTGTATSGTTTAGGTTGTNPWTCYYYPYLPECQNGGTTTGGTTGTGTNPYPNYYSAYVPKNWSVQYPHVPSLDCTAATDPVGIDYTPYDTRQGTITLGGARSYSPGSGTFFATTSLPLRTKAETKKFLWGDSILKVRFKANIQPDYTNTTNVCPDRATGQSTLKGYGKLRFNFILVGVKGNVETDIFSRTIEAKVNSCSEAISLSSYLEAYDSLYFRIENVQGNQNWWADNRFYPNSEQIYDQYGFITPQNSYVENTWRKVRDAECWSLDIEVASDGTKIF